MGDITHLLKSSMVEGSPYNPTAFLRMLYEVRTDYARLMGNESPYGISPMARQAIIDELPNAHLYPDSAYYNLKQVLSDYTGFPESTLVLANGLTQFLDGFYYGFLNPEEAVLFVPPDYGVYRLRLQLFGGVAQLAIRSPPDYRWDIDQILKGITPQIKMLVIVSPNNPVGNSISESDFRRLLDNDVLVVLDEAYFEFAGKTLAHLINDYSNLIVTRTFSKAFGMAGLRLGYAITTPSLADYLTKVLHHFPINRLTTVAAIAALKDTGYLNSVIKRVRRSRDDLGKALNQLHGVKAFPSETNFILCKFTVPDFNSYDIAQKLLENGFIVRDYTGKEGLEGQFIRITVGTDEQNKGLVTALKSILPR